MIGRGIVFVFICVVLARSENAAVERARVLLNQGARQEAVHVLNDAIAKDPANASAQMLLGNALAEDHKKEEALQHLQEAVRLQPRSAAAHNALGEALDGFEEREPALEEFKKAAALDPRGGQAESNWGTVLLELNQPEEATRHLDRALKLFGQNPDAGYTWYVRAKVYSRANDWKQAAVALENAVALRADLHEAWSDLGEARKQLGDDKAAVEAYRRAVNLQPDDAIAQYRLGAEYLRLEQPHAAVEPLEAARKLKPDDQSTLNALQTALRQDGKTEQANDIKKQLAEMLRTKDEERQRALEAVKVNNEGAALEKSGDLRAAAEKYQQALNLNPEHVGMRVNLAIALLRLGQWTQGLNELHEAHERDPENAQITAALKDALSQAPPALVPHWNDNH